MKKLLILALTLSLFSCGPRKPLRKPWTIVSKDISSCSNSIATYYYTDANGTQAYFEDMVDKYSIGQTIN